MRLPAPIDSQSRVLLWTIAVACLRSRAPLSVFHFLLLVVEQSRRRLVTCCVDRIAATSDCVVGCRRWFLSSPPCRPSSVTGIVDLSVPLVGGASQAIFGCGHRRSGRSYFCARRRALSARLVPRVEAAAVGTLLVEAEWTSLPLSPPTPVLRCLVLPAGSGLCGRGMVHTFSSPILLCCSHLSLVSGFTCSTGKSTILLSRSYMMCLCSSR